MEEKLWQTNPDIALKSRNIFDDKGTSSQICGLSSSHVPVFPVSHKEGWMLKNRYFWTVVLEKTLEGPLDSKEFTPVLKEMKPEYSLEGLMLKLKLQYFWPSDMKSWLIGKDPDAEKDWRQEKGMTEDEMVGWHHQLNGHEFEQIWEIVEDREAWCAAIHEVAKSRNDWATEQQENCKSWKGNGRFTWLKSDKIKT